MSYFDRFPSMLYDISKPGVTEPKVVVTKDIIRRVKLRSILQIIYSLMILMILKMVKDLIF